MGLSRHERVHNVYSAIHQLLNGAQQRGGGHDLTFNNVNYVLSKSVTLNPDDLKITLSFQDDATTGGKQKDLSISLKNLKPPPDEHDCVLEMFLTYYLSRCADILSSKDPAGLAEQIDKAQALINDKVALFSVESGEKNRTDPSLKANHATQALKAKIAGQPPK